MIKIENTKVSGWEDAIRGMRNPLNSWEKSDSIFYENGEYHNILGDSGPGQERMEEDFELGAADYNLMKRLAKAGSVEAKYRRMIIVYCDITAPLYWWKEFDTYKVGTVANSCSTMHKIHEKEFDRSDFSYEHILDDEHCICITADMSADPYVDPKYTPMDSLDLTIRMLNAARKLYLKTSDKKYWWQLIQLLPSSYNQRRTVMMNYEVLANIYRNRKNHKLDEWGHEYGFCRWIELLPHSELITGK